MPDSPPTLVISTPHETPVGRVVELVSGNFPAPHSEKHGFGAGSWITFAPFVSMGRGGFALLILARGLSRQWPITITSFILPLFSGFSGT